MPVLPPIPPRGKPCWANNGVCVDIDQGAPFLIIAFLIYLIYKELKKRRP